MTLIFNRYTKEDLSSDQLEMYIQEDKEIRDAFDSRGLTPKFAENIYQTANEILEYNIKDISFSADITTISNTKYAQPSIFIYSVLATYYIQDKGLEFDMVSGHSLGEISALVAAKSISVEDALEHALIAKKINPEHIAPQQLIEIIQSKRN